MRIFALTLAILSLSACAGGGPRYNGPPLKPAANPSAVVAAELAFARTAEEIGQYSALREYAAEDGVIFGRNGTVPAIEWASKQTNPPEATAWKPQAVWSSCDGSLAITRGVLRQADGTRGEYVTVWERQARGEYKYLVDFAFISVDAPPEPEMIAAKTADCSDITVAVASAWATEPIENAANESNDGSLTYEYALFQDGDRSFTASIWDGADMTTVVDLTVPAASADAK